MRMTRWGVGLFLGLGCALAGCTVVPIQLVPSTTPLMANTSYTILGPAEGTSCKLSLYIPPIAFGSGSLASAVEAARTSTGADALINVSVDRYLYYYGIATSSCASVKGDGIKILSK